MKVTNYKSAIILCIMTGFLLTACGNNVSYITDQMGKEISVTTSDTNTITFKLPSDQSIEISETESLETESLESESDAVTSDIHEENTGNETLSLEAPKTGEP